MRIPVTLRDPVGALPAVDYRWDVDTDILTAAMPATIEGGGMTGSVEIEGADGSWLILDVKQGAIASVEVAVWPDVKVVSALTPPADVTDAVLEAARGAAAGHPDVPLDFALTGPVPLRLEWVRNRDAPSRLRLPRLCRSVR